MRSITKLDLQYAHRFYGFKGEAQYLHGHTGTLTIEVEDSVNAGVNMVFPCNEIQKTAWDVLKKLRPRARSSQRRPASSRDFSGIRKTGNKGRCAHKRYERTCVQHRTRHSVSRLPSRRYQRNDDGGRYDKNRLRPFERQTQYRKTYLYQRRQRGFGRISFAPEFKPLPALRNHARRKRRLPQMRLQKTVSRVKTV